MDASLYVRIRTSFGRFLAYFLLSPVLLVLVLLGYIRVRGYARLFRVVKNESLIIASNHPSLLEIFVIPLLFSPLYCLGLSRKIPWSIAAQGLFPDALNTYMRCITVVRNDNKSRIRCLQESCRMINNGMSLIVYPEGGRTIKGTEFIDRHGRRIRTIDRGTLYVAQKTGARIQTMFVDFPNVHEPLSMKGGLLHLLRGNRMTVHVGKLYDPDALSNEDLASLILSAGL